MQRSPDLPLHLLLQLLVLPLFVLLTHPKTNVISTEGGALCRRRGEIPVFRRCLFGFGETAHTQYPAADKSACEGNITARSRIFR
jgi:hypothetical protein